ISDLLLYRIGRKPDPLAWLPWEFAGSGRFDDPGGPAGRYRVLYAAEDPLGAFVESLYTFRPSNELLAAAARLPPGDPQAVSPPLGAVPPGWCDKRLLASFDLSPARPPLAIRQPDIREMIRRALAADLAALGLSDLDNSDLLSGRREVSQRIGRWAYEQGY